MEHVCSCKANILARDCTLNSARRIQSTFSHYISLNILILSSHVRRDFPSVTFSTKVLYVFLTSLMRATCPSHPWFDYLIIYLFREQHPATYLSVKYFEVYLVLKCSVMQQKRANYSKYLHCISKNSNTYAIKIKSKINLNCVELNSVYVHLIHRGMQ